MEAKFDYYLKRRQMTVTTRCQHVNRAKIILKVRQKWSRDEAESWLIARSEDNGYSESTYNKFVQTFNALSDCFDWKWSQKLVQIKENAPAPEMLSDGEIIQLYDLQTSDKYDLIFKLEITTGARPSEILKLQGKDIDLSRGVIALNHTKTRNNRLLFIQDFLAQTLTDYLQEYEIKRDDFLFFYRDRKKPLNIRSFENEMKRRLKLIGVDKNVTPYALRHSFVTRMAAVVNLLQLKELAGHKRISTTERYTHHNEYLLKAAAQKDFLFDGYRDQSDQIKHIIGKLRELADKPNANAAELAQAISHLYAAIQTR